MNTQRNNMNTSPADNGNLTAEALLRKIQALAFAKVECELYLDSHPECASALEHYKKIISEYGELANRYEATVAPIRAENISGDRWSWVDTPWPWQARGDLMED